MDVVASLGRGAADEGCAGGVVGGGSDFEIWGGGVGGAADADDRGGGDVGGDEGGDGGAATQDDMSRGVPLLSCKSESWGSACGFRDGLDIGLWDERVLSLGPLSLVVSLLNIAGAVAWLCERGGTQDRIDRAVG